MSRGYQVFGEVSDRKRKLGRRSSEAGEVSLRDDNPIHVNSPAADAAAFGRRTVSSEPANAGYIVSIVVATAQLGSSMTFRARFLGDIFSDPPIADAVVRRPDAHRGDGAVTVMAGAYDGFSAHDVERTCCNAIASYKRPRDVAFVELDPWRRSASSGIVRDDVERSVA